MLNERSNAQIVYGVGAVHYDEYPFSASMEGGYQRYQQGRVSSRFIPANENMSFGREMRVLRKLKFGDYYIVVPTLLLPSSGVYGM